MMNATDAYSRGADKNSTHSRSAESTVSAATSSPTHVASLHALRGVAAFGVVVLHLDDRLPQLLLGSLTGAFAKLFLMVDFFFLLSGVVLAYIYDQRFAGKVTRGGYADFIIARIARCMPMVVLAAVVAFAANRMLVGTHLDDTPLSTAIAALGIEALGMSGWFNWVWLNPPSWSLTAEFAIYMIAPWLIAATLTFDRRVLWGLMVVLPLVPTVLFPLATRLFLNTDGLTHIPGTALTYFGPQAPWFWIVKGPFILCRALPLFICGVCAYRLWRLGETDRFAQPWLMLVMIVAVGLTMHFGLPRIAVVAALIGLVLTSLGGRTGSHPWFDVPLMRWLGNVSLGIYLLHSPIFDMIEAGWRGIAGYPVEQAGTVAAYMLMAAMLLTTLAVASLCYRRFEFPMRSLIRRNWSNRRKDKSSSLQPMVVPSSMAFFISAIVVAALSVPLGILSQGWILSNVNEGRDLILEDMVDDQKMRRIVVNFRVSGDSAEAGAVPVTVRGRDGWAAQIGPNMRNSRLVRSGELVSATLTSREVNTGTPAFDVYLPERMVTFTFDGDAQTFSQEAPLH